MKINQSEMINLLFQFTIRFMEPRPPAPNFTPEMGFEKIQNLIQEVEKVTKGKRHEIEMIITCLLAKGHILIEDNPGSGKTVTARALAATIAGGKGEDKALFKRIQFTPDLLPMDLIGSHIFDEDNKDFIFKKGPLFSNVLLADEINRASPKVQSALLECMAEGQITIGEQTFILDPLFFVIATQNPIEMEGTYPLPAAQLDRFFMKISFGYVDEETERNIFKQYTNIEHHLHHLQQCIQKPELLALQTLCNEVTVHDEIIQAVLNIIQATRNDANIVVGASTRSGIAFLKCLRAYAMIKGRKYVIEDDVQMIAHNVLHHRLTFKNKVGQTESMPRIIKNEMNRLQSIPLS